MESFQAAFPKASSMDFYITKYQGKMMESMTSRGLLLVDASHTAMESGCARPSQASKDDAGVHPAKRARCHNRISSFTVGSCNFGCEDTLMTKLSTSVRQNRRLGQL